MKREHTLPHLSLALSLALLCVSCVTSRGFAHDGEAQRGNGAPSEAWRGGDRADETPRGRTPVAPQQAWPAGHGSTHARPLPLGLRELPEGRWQLLFPPRMPNPELEVLHLEEVRPLMVRADSGAIHELYMLDGTLVRRHVPAGVSYP